MEIRPTPVGLDQFVTGADNSLVRIDDDVQGVANALRDIHPNFRLRFSERGEYFVVYYKPDEWEEGDGYLVTTAQELDHRIVKLVERIFHRTNNEDYSFADELERLEQQRKAEADHRFTEQHGEMFERMAHAMRKDLGYTGSKAFVPDTPATEKISDR